PVAAVAAAVNTRGFLLVPKSKSAPDAPTIDALRAVGARSIVIVGGTSGIPSAYEGALRTAGFTVERKATNDRYSLSVLMAKDRAQTPQRVVVTNPDSSANTAIAAALAAASGQPLVYSIQLCMVDGVASYIRSVGVTLTIVGSIARLSTAVLRNSSCTEERQHSASTLNAAIRETLSRYQGTYSVTVRQEGGLNVGTSVSGTTLREPASMIKIFAAWAALSRIQSGRASFGTVLPSGVDLRMCIHVMIHASDNYCHTDIVHWIGIAELNRMIRAAGFGSTSYGSVPVGVSVLYAGNRTTTNDLVSMVRALKNGTALSRPYADHLLGEMRNQIGRSRIASGIPPKVVQASKPGALWVASGLLQGDTAVVYGPKYTYYLSIVGDGSPPKAAFQAVSRTVYEHFHGAFGAAAWYPAQQLVTVRATGLRSSPGGPMVVVAPAGTFLENFETNRIWYEVQYGSRKLWTIVTDLRNR
ncbi:MAG: serine hydrolase, partial [Microbacterium sp.]